MSVKEPYYITTPIYYVNDVPHLGHAYTTIACDVMARFKRLDGHEVYFLTGTDEHGQKVAQSAEARGITPQEMTDIYSQNFRDLLPKLAITNDDFIRTTEARHKSAAQALWNKLIETGNIYLSKYSGWYAVRDEAYYGEEELKEVNGKKIAPSGAECEWVEEDSYFFKLSAWGDKLLEYYEQNPDFILPESRRNEVISFVKSGLRDLSVSRTRMDWGIAVPESDGHVMYVWIDALTNYLTGIGYPDQNSESFKKFWPASLHMVGKDIMRFHTVYWPAFLWAAGLEAPKRVFAHGWWTVEGQKMSKSLGNVIAPLDLVERYGLEQSRYVLLREVPFGNDGDFSHDNAVARINAELANGLGNLVQRTLSQVYKNCDEKIPQPSAFTADDIKLLNMARDEMIIAMRNEIDVQRFHRALEAIVQVVYEANAYIDTQAPWALKKTDLERMNTVLYVLCETIRCIALAMLPVTPDAANKILDQLSVPSNARDFSQLSAEHALTPGVSIPKPEGVFPRIVDDAQKEAIA
jgi:methionyl-tRNA synthetase